MEFVVENPTIAAKERSNPSPLRNSVALSLRGFPLRPAFTMIEMIVVVVLIGIIGAMVVPRALRSERRLAERECEDVRRLLSVAAGRSTLSGQGVLVTFDARDKTISVFVLSKVDTSDGAKNAWQRDPLIPAVELQSLTFRRGTADQQGLNASGWSAVFPTAEPRPMLWLVFAPASDPEAMGWQIELMPDETGASKRQMTERSRAAAAGLFRIDLDATNQGERAW